MSVQVGCVRYLSNIFEQFVPYLRRGIRKTMLCLKKGTSINESKMYQTNAEINLRQVTKMTEQLNVHT
jgi:hypothetical protein